MAMFSLFWDDEKLGRLEIMCQSKDYTAAEIAKELGCTRNAAIGRIRRSGLSLRAPTGIVMARMAPRPRPLPPSPVVLSPYEPTSLCLGMMELTDRTYRFPDSGDSDFTFCGHPPATARIYCPFHCSVAYQKPVARMR